MVRGRSFEAFGGGFVNGQYAGPPLPIRLLVAGLFLATWVWAGLAIHAGTNVYLLMGVPWVIVFQRFVRDRPLRNAWVFHELRPRLDRWAIAFGSVAAIPPLLSLLSTFRSPTPPDQTLTNRLWLVAATLGAFGVGLTLRRQRAAALRKAASATLAAVVAALILFTVAAGSAGRLDHLLHPSARAVRYGLESLLLYIDVSFVLEEVVFRGVLDPYLLGAERGPNAQYASAIVGSALWGAWHLPVLVDTGSMSAYTLLQTIVAHASLGFILCVAARRAGTLLPSAFAHAVADAYRNFLA
jgi:hypothetical protein